MEGTQSYIGTPCGLVVCIDDTTGGRLSGRFYHFYSRKCHPFCSMDELVFGMEELFEALKFPYPSVKRRDFSGRSQKGRAGGEASPGCSCKRGEPHNFAERRKVMGEEELLAKHGDLGTFIIRVQHRQNSSWQGRITWSDKNKTVNFRSIWEMVRLIGDALDTVSQPEGVEQEAQWPE